MHALLVLRGPVRCWLDLLAEPLKCAIPCCYFLAEAIKKSPMAFTAFEVSTAL